MRFLFSVLNSHGYVFPAVAIACELRKQGHTTAFITSSAFHNVLTENGFERIPYAVGEEVAFQVRRWGEPAVLDAQVRNTAHALKTYRPDAVLASQFAQGTIAICGHHKIPVAALGFAGFPFAASDDRMNFVETAADYRFRELGERYLTACRLGGIPAIPKQVHSVKSTPIFGDVCLIQSIAEFSCTPVAPQVRFVGACLWEPEYSDPSLDRWLHDSPQLPLVYAQPGRSFGGASFWPSLLAAVHDKPVRVVASTARMDGGGSVSMSSQFFVKSHVAQTKALKHVRAVLCNATTTAVLGAISEGVPCLLFPGGSAQPELARDCERAGFGITMPMEQVTPSAVWLAMERVLFDADLKTKALRIRDAFAAINGPQTAATLLVGLASAAKSAGGAG